jgi:hypothetical protein
VLSDERNPRHSPLLIGTGVFALLWVVARASVQSLTIDEADTYLSWVRPAWPSHWSAYANNHVLNSMLMRLFTSIFGASALTLRLPALIGALLYIGAAYVLARLISQRRLLQWALFVCLTFSPFVMDYLVAARGYSLASAFLLWMVAIAARHQALGPQERVERWPRACALISLCGGLSVSANFSFALADGLTALGLFLWICREHRRQYGKILAACTLPGLAAAYFLVWPVVTAWPGSQLAWGADSLLETVRSLVSASLFEPNPYLLHPQLRHYFVHFGTFLYPLLAAFVIWRAVTLILGRRLIADDAPRRLAALAAICGAALAAALACHQFLHLVYGILLPLDRTAMWVALLFLTMAGALAAAPLPTRMGRISAQALTAILALIACYNVACLRLTYFNEWKYDAGTKNVYGVLAYYNHTYGVSKVSANWRYVAALNCYRVMSGHETIEPIPVAPTVADAYPLGYQAYVFYYGVDEDFYKREGLQLVYRDAFTGAAVAVRPEVLAHAGPRQ